MLGKRVGGDINWHFECRNWHFKFQKWRLTFMKWTPGRKITLKFKEDFWVFLMTMNVTEGRLRNRGS